MISRVLDFIEGEGFFFLKIRCISVMGGRSLIWGKGESKMWSWDVNEIYVAFNFSKHSQGREENTSIGIYNKGGNVRGSGQQKNWMRAMDLKSSSNHLIFVKKGYLNTRL
jgi:hypothetical protein